MATIRQIAACAGRLTLPLSVRALFGEAPTPLSALHLARQRTQKKIDLNIILVGWEAFVPMGLAEIEAAVDHVRDLYAAIDLGIGKVSYFGISLDDADGYENIDSGAEADALTAQWGFAGKAVDSFFVLSWAGRTVGRSPINGPCGDHDEPDSAVVVAIETPTSMTGNTLAH